MPLYEYNCQGCHKNFEFIQKFSDPIKTTCPECGGKLVKNLSAAGFSLKGGGWYADGYAKGENKKPTASNSENTCSGTPSTCSQPSCPAQKN